MKVAFDLDGTLDRPPVLALCKTLLASRHSVYILTGCFLEAGNWQGHGEKYEKLARLGLIQYKSPAWWPANVGDHIRIHIFDAADHARFDRDYRLADIGLRKGAFIEKEGIEIMFDDSELYCKLMPAYCGAQIVHVR